MKKQCALIVFLLSFSSSFSQVSFGVKAGANFSNMSVEDNAYDFDFIEDDGTGFHIGSFLDLKFNTNLGGQAEVLFSRSGIKDQYVDYISVPVFVKWYPISPLNIGVGPQVSFFADAEGSKENYEKTVLAAFANIGFNISDFVISARYILGISNSVEQEFIIGSPPSLNLFTANAKENIIQVSFGYRF